MLTYRIGANQPTFNLGQTGRFPILRRTFKHTEIRERPVLTPPPTPPILAKESGYAKAEDAMTGIQFVTDDKGHRVAVQIDLKKHGAIWEDFWDGLVSESRRKEKSILYEQFRTRRLKRGQPRG